MVIGSALLKNFETVYAYKELNALTADIAQGGILQANEQLKPSVSNDIITIAPGVVAFNSGTRLRISEPIEFALLDGIIYASYSTITQTGGLYFSADEPQTEYIPVCSISEGTMTDIRKIAQYNVARTEGNIYTECEVGTGDYVNNAWRALTTYEMPGDFSAAIIDCGTAQVTGNGTLRRIELVDGTECEPYTLYLKSRGSATCGDIFGCKGKISRNGRTLTFWARRASTADTDKYYPQYALADKTFYLL